MEANEERVAKYILFCVSEKWGGDSLITLDKDMGLG